MDEFIPLCRRAFRVAHGLPSNEPTPFVPAEEQVPLLAWARRHRVTGMLQAGLPGMGPARQSAAYGQAQHTARCTLEAERLFAQLAPALPTLALIKGPALAAQAWPEPGLRSFDDLDFLCAPGDYPELLEGMRAASYLLAVEDPRRMAHLWHYGWGVAFRHPAGFMVEVNHRFFPPHYPWPLRLDGSQEGLFRMQTLDGAAVRVPTPALHLLLGCLHAVWHGWTRLAWLADIAGLLVRHPEIFPQAEACTAGCPFARQALVAGCGVAEALFGPGLASPPLPAAPPEVIPAAMAFLQGTTRDLAGRELRTLHEQFMTGAEKAAYRVRWICTPGDGDFKWISLPPALRGLYWPLRPMRAAIYGSSGD
jgi:hypothetical protein